MIRGIRVMLPCVAVCVCVAVCMCVCVCARVSNVLSLQFPSTPSSQYMSTSRPYTPLVTGLPEGPARSEQ